MVDQIFLVLSSRSFSKLDLERRIWMRALQTYLLGATLLVGVWTGSSIAQVRGVPPSVERATDAGAQAQDRARVAQDRISQAADAAARSQDRTTAAQERATRGADAASGAVDRADAAQDRLDQMPEARARGARFLETASDIAKRLAERRLRSLEAMVLAAPAHLEMTQQGPVVKAQVIAIDPDEETISRLQSLGYILLSEEMIEGVEIRAVLFALPADITVSQALASLQTVAPDAEFAANHIHVQSNSALLPLLASETLAPKASVRGKALGIVDGGVADHPLVRAPVEHRGFAVGGPVPSPHGTAIASLISGTSKVKAAAPGTSLLVADVFGRDPSGGSSLAIARAVGWLVSRDVPVIVVSLVGAPNALVRTAVTRAQAAGTQIVAPVGNGGPAAPLAYPASYPGVIAVTGVDRQNRPLIEAGRSKHIDYAAPADIRAAALSGNLATVRGTSFAAPLVAGKLFSAGLRHPKPIEVLDREAVDLGAKGPDPVFGRGLICGRCR